MSSDLSRQSATGLGHARLNCASVPP